MQKTRLVLLWFLFVLSLGDAASTFGQVAIGTPPLGSFGGGPEAINLANLNSHLSVPIIEKTGRGMEFGYAVTYDSSVWTPVTSGSTAAWVPDGTWGWGADTQVSTGYASASVEHVYPCYEIIGTKQVIVGYIYDYSNYFYVDKFAQRHPFTGTSQSVDGNCGSAQPYGFTNTTSDGSGYTIVVGGSAGLQVIARNGANVLPQLNLTTGSATKTDPNGNQISVNNSGVFTDTLGTTALTVSGSAPSPKVMTYTPPAGGSAAYKMIYTPLTILTNFGCSGIGEYSATNVSMVTEIDLPRHFGKCERQVHIHL